MQNYGWIEPTFDSEDYKFGSSKLGGEILVPEADWRPYLPVFEHQRMKIETMACVSFGNLSALEMIHLRRYQVEPNYSDRFTAKLSDTTRNGNTPKKVMQTIRHSGTIFETQYPFNVTTWEDYYKEIPEELVQQGLGWLDKYEIGYEWVDESQLRGALKMSPIGVAVSAWSRNEKGEYFRQGRSNHWCQLVAYEGQNPIVWDSYEESLKKLTPDHKLEFCMRYEFKKRTVTPRLDDLSFWDRLRLWFNR